ncbi:hypothetical protein [Halomonas aquatica]|uniref:Uncharacterized protein n=1 Tax=Halomonas aquatica TaxID=3151123 RepID=A0ABV1NGW1_9GAMM
MTDDSRPQLILPGSLLKRRLGLIEGAMPDPLPNQWAEHLELISKNGSLRGVDDLLALMLSELNRIQGQIDAYQEPDRHSETAMAAAMAELLDEWASPEQRGSLREVYFALLLGYLYGRLTKPGQKAMGEATKAHIKVLQADHKRRQGAQISAEASKAEAAGKKAEAKRIWDKLIREGRAEHGLPQLVQDRLAAQGIHVSVDTVTRWARIGGWRRKTKKRTR